MRAATPSGLPTRPLLKTCRPLAAAVAATRSHLAINVASFKGAIAC